MINKIEIVCKEYHSVLENNSINFPTGTCYLSAYCLTEFFKKNNCKANVVVGELALRNIKNKYAIYGSMKFKKSERVGVYHALCELELDNEVFIIDPSLKYNKVYLKKSCNFKTAKSIPDILISKERKTYNYIYVVNEKFTPNYQKFVDESPDNNKMIIDHLLKSSKIY